MAEHFEEVLSIRVDELTRSVDARFDAVDARFDAVDARFDAVDARIEAQAQATSAHVAEMRDVAVHNFTLLRADFHQLSGRVERLECGMGRVERRLDRHEDLLVEVLTEVRSLKRD